LAGRISRSIYWLCFVLFVSLEAALVRRSWAASRPPITAGLAILPAVLLITLYSNIAVAVKRLHDLGYSGFLALALLIPFVNLAFTIWVGICPAPRGRTATGPCPTSLQPEMPAPPAPPHCSSISCAQ
jgi:uncharacterized membrane protein YhaH (DUF805 family)